jgi:hypothetical protein
MRTPARADVPSGSVENSTANAIVQTRAKAISFPMLDIPGYVDAHMLPNATAFVIALKTIARVSADCSSPVCPARHAMM